MRTFELLAVRPVLYGGDGILSDERGRTIRPGDVGLFTEKAAERLLKRGSTPADWDGPLEHSPRLKVERWSKKEQAALAEEARKAALDEEARKAATPSTGDQKVAGDAGDADDQKPTDEVPTLHPQQLVFDVIVSADKADKALSKKNLAEKTKLSDEDLSDALNELTKDGHIRYAHGYYRLTES